MIRLEDIDEGNWRYPLKVSESQRNYVANSSVMLARAYAYRNQRSRAFLICEDETPVGMGLYHDCTELGAYDFSQLFIDERYQGRGYGKAVLCYIEGNDAAKKLYENFGFVETDRDEDDIIMERTL